jgi:hypothetical protein
MRNPLTSIGRFAVRHARRAWSWLVSERGRRMAKRTLACALAIVLSPQLVALWNIALYGERVQQGVLWCVLVILWYLRAVWHDRKPKEGKRGKTVSGATVEDKPVQRTGEGVRKRRTRRRRG